MLDRRRALRVLAEFLDLLRKGGDILEAFLLLLLEVGQGVLIIFRTVLLQERRATDEGKRITGAL